LNVPEAHVIENFAHHRRIFNKRESAQSKTAAATDNVRYRRRETPRL
jgi:hypothetical protein